MYGRAKGCLESPGLCTGDDKLEAFGWHVQQTFGVNSTILLSHDQQSADLRLVAR
jgi:hypothetical protein